MVFLGFSPCFILSLFFTSLLLDRGIHATGNKQFPTSSPWYPSTSSPGPAKITNADPEALKIVLPLVSFDCTGKTGYFPDAKFNCEVFHYCQPNGARNTFHCPTNQLFNQLSMVCEENTSFNSRLCKEGSITPTKLQKNSFKKHDALLKASLKSLLNESNASPKKISLEDLLSYMNRGQLGKELEPTFMSSFHNTEEAKKLKSSSDREITSVSESKTVKTKKPSHSIDAHLEAQGSNQSVSITPAESKFGSYSKKNDEELGEVAADYETIDGRKLRKHKRVGRVLDILEDQQPKQAKEAKSHAHLTTRSISDVLIGESTTVLPPSDDVEAKNGNNPSLFSTDRNKAKDIRKRKRYQGRKRKVTTPGTGNETDTEITTTMIPISQTAKQDLDSIRSNVYRRRKSQRTRVRDDAVKSDQKAEKVVPYTLPPLPVPEEEKIESTTESIRKEEKKGQIFRDGRSKSSWHNSAPSSDGAQFGAKVSDLDQHYYQTDVKMAEGPAPPAENYRSKNVPDAPEDMLRQENRDRMMMQPENADDMHTVPIKDVKMYGDDDSYKTDSYSNKHHSTLPADLFPPPRAEPREHHSTPPQEMMISHESGAEKSKSPSSLKESIDDSFRVTRPYMNKYQTGVHELKDMEEQRWKADADKLKPSDVKVEVGSTFYSQDPITHETTKKPRLQIPPTTEAPVTDSVNKEKDIPKHTLAHQHLSKIMNDFFAMSSPSIPGRPHVDSSIGEELIVPEYRIPDEDIYSGSESATEDVEEIPPELLEVVDLLTDHVVKEKSDLKSRTNHEIIKINGPITDSHLEKIFLDDKFDEESGRQQTSDKPKKKIVILPQPIEDKEDLADSEEVAGITSLNIESLLKHISDEKSLRLIPLKTEPVLKQPTVLTAKKIPVRMIYRDQLSEAFRSKLTDRKPSIKIIQTPLTAPRMKIISNDKRLITTPISHSFNKARSSIVMHPPPLFSPHPSPSPPFSRKPLPFRVGYPFVTNSRSLMQNSQIHHRRKRSTMGRLRRQIQQNQHFLPFSSPVFPSFNPKFAPTFTPFKSVFSPISLRTSGTHINPFSFPGINIAKPSQDRPHMFQPAHPRPPPVRHITQNGHQTVIVEEVPVPIHVEVPSPNLMHPVSSGTHLSKANERYPGNEYRTPSPPAIQTPPLLQGPQNRFPHFSFPPQPNNYPLLGMPSNARSPPPYQSPIPLTGPLPPSITSQGQVYALGVTNKPILQPNHPPARPPNGGPKPVRNPPRPYNPFSVHASAYPNFPYFQGAFTTPISNEPVVGRLMYSGYKPPKSTVGTKPPKSSKPNKERKPSESKSSRSRSKPTQDYFEAPAKPMRESHVSYTEEVIARVRPPKPHLSDYSIDHTDLKPPKQSLSTNVGSFDEAPPRKRRPGKRRRPRPHPTTTQGTPTSNNISPTPPPPEQIPPPPADYTSKPSHLEIQSSFPTFNEGTKAQETSSAFPPAGYYGKDQLIQFFDTSSNSYPKATSPKPYHHRDFESTSSAERDESITSISGEDGSEPAFGTRLRSKPQTQSRSRQFKNNQPARSQTQKTEVRTRPANRPEQMVEKKREFTQPKPNENGKTPIRNDRPPPRRRRPPPPRPRNRPPPVPAPQPEVHHFKYNDNIGGFYSVPRGLQNFVAPSEHPQQGFRGSTDMFGIPHPVIDPSIYSLRPQGAPEFDPNFFSVPAHVAQQQQSPLNKMNVKPIPDSAKEFFTAPENLPSSASDESAPKKKETEHRNSANKPRGESNEQDPPVRKLRKPKRKNRYNPHSTEQRESAEVSSAKPETEQMTTRDSSTTRYKEKSTSVVTTTPEPRSTAAINYHSQNDIKENPVFKQRTPLLPKTLPELSKSIANGKIDFQKLNATVSTSVSVSGAIPQTNNTSSEEKENKKVFSSQNGGLAVVRKGPKRKRARQRVGTTTGVPYVNNDEPNTDAKYEIAASVLDIIKATTETERQASGYYNNQNSENPASSRVTNTWVESPSHKRQT